MSVANDVALAVDLLGSGVVIRRSVHEVAGLEVLYRHCDGERGVGSSNVLTVHRADELGRWDVRGGGNDPHRGGIARTRLDLLSVRDRQIWHGEAEIDKVVAGGEGCNLTGLLHCLAVLFKTGGNNSRIES